MNDQKPPPSYDVANAGISNAAYPGYPPQQQPPQYQYPPIIQPTNAVAPPPYEDGKTNYGGESAYEGDVEANLHNYPVISGVVSFSEKSIRLGFIRKVFAILSLQMVVTIAMTAWFLFHEPTKDYVQSSWGLYIGSYCLFFVLYFVLVCCSKVARKHPINLILLGIFTLSLGYLVAAISSFHETKIVLAAFGMTIVCTFAIIVFASQTKYDVTTCSGILFASVFCLFLFGIFAGVLVPYGYMRIVNVVYAALGALLFMAFLAYDIQTLMGGKKYELNPEDYVYAALQLYVDVTYIFLFILQLFSGGK